MWFNLSVSLKFTVNSSPNGGGLFFPYPYKEGYVKFIAICVCIMHIYKVKNLRIQAINNSI